VHSLRDNLIAAGCIRHRGPLPEIPARTYHAGPVLRLDRWAELAAERAIAGYHANGPAWNDTCDNTPAEVPSDAAD
jgi:hypothetical protein